MPLSLSLGLGLSSRNTGGGAPYGFVFLTDADGAILTDDDGAFLMEAA